MIPTIEKIVSQVSEKTGIPVVVLMGERGPVPRWASRHRSLCALLAERLGHVRSTIKADMNFLGVHGVPSAINNTLFALGTDGDLLDLANQVLLELSPRARPFTGFEAQPQPMSATSTGFAMPTWSEAERYSRTWFLAQDAAFVKAMRAVYPERELKLDKGRFIKPGENVAVKPINKQPVRLV